MVVVWCLLADGVYVVRARSQSLAEQCGRCAVDDLGEGEGVPQPGEAGVSAHRMSDRWGKGGGREVMKGGGGGLPRDRRWGE